MQLSYQNNINPGYGMHIQHQPMMNQNMNNINNFNNNPQMNTNMGYPQSMPFLYQNFQQQNKGANKAGNLLDFF